MTHGAARREKARKVVSRPACLPACLASHSRATCTTRRNGSVAFVACCQRPTCTEGRRRAHGWLFPRCLRLAICGTVPGSSAGLTPSSGGESAAVFHCGGDPGERLLGGWVVGESTANHIIVVRPLRLYTRKVGRRFSERDETNLTAMRHFLVPPPSRADGHCVSASVSMRHESGRTREQADSPGAGSGRGI